MTGLRDLLDRHLPSTALGRVRLSVLILGVLLSLLHLGQLVESPGRRAAAVVSALAIVGAMLLTYTRRRILWPEPLLVAPVAVLLGACLRDPLSIVSVVLGIAAMFSMYGSALSAAVRTPLLMAVPPVTVALSPIAASRGIQWNDAPVINLVPVALLFTVLMRTLFGTLLRQERGLARQAVLAAAGRRLIGSTDLDEVTEVGRGSARGLTEVTPGLAMVRLVRDDDRLRVFGAYGVDGLESGTLLPLGLVARVDPDDTETLVPLDGDTRALDLLVGRRRRWVAAGLGQPDRETYVLVADAHDDVLDSIRSHAAQLSLAAQNCAAHTELSHRAHHDQLTTMPNRAAFFQQLTAAVEAADRGESPIALLAVDLDDFKQVNDTFGHAAGDDLLVEVAARMTEVIGEAGTAARFGGDEFAVLLDGVTDPEQAVRLAHTLREQLLEPIRLEAAIVTVGASIGLALHQPGTTAGDLIRCADIAMYSAKARGKNRVERFTPARHGEIASLRLLEEHLATALASGEIGVHYQPIVDLKTRRCVGVEALARWQHPSLGMIEPSTFIPLAERSGFAKLLGDVVLRTACRQAATWGDLVPGAEALRVSVNVFGRQLSEPGFVDAVREHLAVSGLPAERLTLELTETDLLEDEVVRGQLEAVSALGVRVSLDDFGAGYASLANLHSVPVHQLKIDRRLLGRDANRPEAMVELIMSVSQFLELETVAEAVETEEHADWARRAGIPLAQGHLFARAMPPEQLPGWLSETGATQVTAEPAR